MSKNGNKGDGKPKGSPKKCAKTIAKSQTTLMEFYKPIVIDLTDDSVTVISEMPARPLQPPTSNASNASNAKTPDTEMLSSSSAPFQKNRANAGRSNSNSTSTSSIAPSQNFSLHDEDFIIIDDPGLGFKSENKKNNSADKNSTIPNSSSHNTNDKNDDNHKRSDQGKGSDIPNKVYLDPSQYVKQTNKTSSVLSSAASITASTSRADTDESRRNVQEKEPEGAVSTQGIADDTLVRKRSRKCASDRSTRNGSDARDTSSTTTTTTTSSSSSTSRKIVNKAPSPPLEVWPSKEISRSLSYTRRYTFNSKHTCNTPFYFSQRNAKMRSKANGNGETGGLGGGGDIDVDESTLLYHRYFQYCYGFSAVFDPRMNLYRNKTSKSKVKSSRAKKGNDSHSQNKSKMSNRGKKEKMDVEDEEDQLLALIDSGAESGDKFEGNDGDNVIVCDGCDQDFFMQEIGITVVPSGHWFCVMCASNKAIYREEEGEDEEKLTASETWETIKTLHLTSASVLTRDLSSQLQHLIEQNRIISDYKMPMTINWNSFPALIDNVLYSDTQDSHVCEILDIMKKCVFVSSSSCDRDGAIYDLILRVRPTVDESKNKKQRKGAHCYTGDNNHTSNNGNKEEHVENTSTMNKQGLHLTPTAMYVLYCLLNHKFAVMSGLSTNSRSQLLEFADTPISASNMNSGIHTNVITMTTETALSVPNSDVFVMENRTQSVSNRDPTLPTTSFSTIPMSVPRYHHLPRTKEIVTLLFEAVRSKDYNKTSNYVHQLSTIQRAACQAIPGVQFVYTNGDKCSEKDDPIPAKGRDAVCWDAFWDYTPSFTQFASLLGAMCSLMERQREEEEIILGQLAYSANVSGKSPSTSQTTNCGSANNNSDQDSINVLQTTYNSAESFVEKTQGALASLTFLSKLLCRRRYDASNDDGDSKSRDNEIENYLLDSDNVVDMLESMFPLQLTYVLPSVLQQENIVIEEAYRVIEQECVRIGRVMESIKACGILPASRTNGNGNDDGTAAYYAHSNVTLDGQLALLKAVEDTMMAATEVCMHLAHLRYHHKDGSSGSSAGMKKSSRRKNTKSINTKNISAHLLQPFSGINMYPSSEPGASAHITCFDLLPILQQQYKSSNPCSPYFVELVCRIYQLATFQCKSKLSIFKAKRANEAMRKKMNKADCWDLYELQELRQRMFTRMTLSMIEYKDKYDLHLERMDRSVLSSMARMVLDDVIKKKRDKSDRGKA